MLIQSTTRALAEISCDALILPLWDNQPLTGLAAEVDRATEGMLQSLLDDQLMNRKTNEVTTLLRPRGLAAKRLVVVGLGPAAPSDLGRVYEALATASRTLAGNGCREVVLLPAGLDQGAQVETAVAGVLLGTEGQDLYRREKSQTPFERLWVAGVGDDQLTSGQILGEAVNLTRRLVNEPPQAIYPETFAEEARRVAQQHDMQCEIWDEQRLEQERCGALLAVGRGSHRPPRLVQLRYQGADANAPPLALVGKGVTFDSGGYSLKPSDSMLHMKMDMAGAATVLGAMQAIAALRLPINVVGLMGLVENMVSANSYKLGDVLTARNGKTIEVHNTDAEGRLVLADVLSVACDSGMERIVDLATLTGACMVALGRDVAGLMTNRAEWGQAVLSAARTVGEPMWELPMFAAYDEQIKSEVADIKNVGDGRWGGAITAAKLLEQFVDDRPWSHIDIAGPAFVESNKPWLAGGASGRYVRTLVQLARNLADSAGT